MLGNKLCKADKCNLYYLSRAFDFEGNERWKKYVMNLEIPPGRDTSAVIERFKAKWYKREIVSPHTSPPSCYVAEKVPL